jgi:MYXO-CTERM domain-containing protein
MRRAGLIGGFATALMVACSGGERGEDVGVYEEAVTDLILLNEIKLDPPGTPNGPEQFIELRGTPNGLLSDYYLAVLEGDVADGSDNRGVAEFVVNLGTACGGVCTLGANGLFLIKRTAKTAADGTTSVLTISTATSPVFGFDLTNDFPNSASVLLVQSATAITQNTDYDANNDGTLDNLPTGAIILDAIGWRMSAANNRVYGGVELPLVVANDVPDALSRFDGNNTPKSAAAWFYGEIAGTAAAGLAYNLALSSANTPSGADLTPAGVNFAEGSGGAAGAGGGGAGGESGGGVGGVPPIPTGGTGPDPVGGAGSGGVPGPAGAGGAEPAGAGGAEPAGAGGAPAPAGAGGTDTGEGGTPSSGGSPAAGTSGQPAGGTAPIAGSGGTSTVAGSGGTAGRGGSGGITTAGKAGSAGSGTPGGGDDDDDGCGCRTPGRGTANHGALAALALGFAAMMRRRRKTR